MRDEFIEQYIRDFGTEPDEETIRYCLGDDYRQKRPSIKPSHHHSTGQEDLYSEIKDTIAGIANNARVAVNGKAVSLQKNMPSNEFNYMLLIFLAKTGLYFLFKHSYEDGYDFSNI